MIDLDALSALCSDFGVNPEWLLLGIGDMLKRISHAHQEKIKILAPQA